LSLAIGAVAMGSGIALMHYTGMAAMNTSPPITYDNVLVVVSIALAIAASGLALSLAFRLRGDVATRTILRRLLGAIAMGIGICTMHYTGMAAAQFAPGTICTGPGLQIDQHTLAIAVAAAALLVERQEQVSRSLDILDRQVEEDLLGAQALGCQGPQAEVIVLRFGNGVHENGRVGGHAADFTARDHPSHFAVLQQAALDIVIPDRLTGLQ
jgi:hypothetical protein